MIDIPVDVIGRETLSRVFGQDNRTLLAFEALAKVAQTVPGVAAATETAQTTAEAAAVAATAAQTTADTIAAAAFLVLTASTALSAERVLTGDTGVTLDVATAGLAKIVVDPVAILNALAAIVLTAPVDVQAALRCDSLRVDTAPTATATVSTHSLPINCNGTVYYMRLSAVP